MFSDRLKGLREDNDLTQLELAKMLDISRSALSGYESRGREPDFKTLVKIADFFDVSTDYLLCRTNKMFPFHKYK